MRRNAELSEIETLLRDRKTLRVELRGTGKASFLFVRSATRAAEVSVEEDGFQVEYWNHANEDSDEVAVKNETVVSAAEVVDGLTQWLLS